MIVKKYFTQESKSRPNTSSSTSNFSLYAPPINRRQMYQSRNIPHWNLTLNTTPKTTSQKFKYKLISTTLSTPNNKNTNKYPEYNSLQSTFFLNKMGNLVFSSYNIYIYTIYIYIYIYKLYLDLKYNTNEYLKQKWEKKRVPIQNNFSHSNLLDKLNEIRQK